jgi:hypothetical protein
MDEFLAELKPLLSTKSLKALDDPKSAQSQSLQWLFESSNFQEWPLDRQVQRYAMATVYYATGGPSWSNAGDNWLTNESECTWVQGSEGNFCGEKGKLLFLKQRNTNLNGMIPDDIRLLSSLTVIDLSNNNLSGRVPSELGSLTSLMYLSLSVNSFTGITPLEIGSLSKLTYLDLSGTSLIGTVPELQQCNLAAVRIFVDCTKMKECSCCLHQLVIVGRSYCDVNGEFLERRFNVHVGIVNR